MRLTPGKNWYCALLEYKRYKSVLDELRELEESRSFRNYRGNASKELRKLANVALVDAELESLNLFKLLRAFERVMQRYEDKEARKTVHTVMRYSYTIADQQEYIFSRIQPKNQPNLKIFSENWKTGCMPSSPSWLFSKCSIFSSLS
jgi:segregation and condensation protein A